MNVLFNENDFVQYTDELSFAIYDLCTVCNIDTKLRVWYCNTDNTFCFQLLIDDDVDVDIIELSNGYITIE